jgi:acyl carrier protein
MTNQEFCNEFAGILEIPPNIITDEYVLEENVAWDSLAFISTIVLIDKYYNIIVDSDFLQKAKTFGDIQSLLLKKVA